MQTIGRYQLVEKLGEGGMGVVYRGFDPVLERVVAVKLIASLEANDELRERFFREARSAGQLAHKNIITVYDLGEHEGKPFLAMEYLEGQDLQQRLAARTPMSLSRKLDLSIEICEGIEYAHVHGVIHRDIKPANVFITSSGTAKILDFGLARLITSELTNSNMMMGTLNYMAPEQVRGERADHRSDIFSTGVVLYELFGGRKAFEGDSFGATLYKILEEIPEPLAKLNAELPPEVIAIVERALEKPRDSRYQHMSEMLRDLWTYRQQLALANSPASGGSVARPASDAVTMPATPTPIPSRASGTGSAQAAASAPASAAGSASAARRPSTASDAAPGIAVPLWRRPAPLGGAAAALLLIGLTAWGVTRDDRGTDDSAAERAPATPGPETAAAAAAAQRDGTIARHLATGREHLAAARFDQASTAAGDALALDPSNDEAKRLMRESAERSRGRGIEEARGRTARAKEAATAAGARTLAPVPYRAAAVAEREAADLLARDQAADAMSKLYEASGLYRSAEVAAQTEAAARLERARLARSSAGSTGSAAPAAQPTADSRPAAAPPTPVPPSVPVPVPATPSITGLPLPSSTAPAAPVIKPPPAPPTAEPAPTATLTSAILDLLGRYEAALEARSLDALKRLWPGIDPGQENAIRYEFQNARRIEVDVVGPQIQVSGGTATVTFVRRYRIETVDRQRLSTETRTTMDLRRNGTDWTIDRIRFEPVR